MLSIHIQLHETFSGSLRGIRENVQLTLKINNTNPSSYYNDFGVGKSIVIKGWESFCQNYVLTQFVVFTGLQPVWFSQSKSSMN